MERGKILTEEERRGNPSEQGQKKGQGGILRASVADPLKGSRMKGAKRERFATGREDNVIYRKKGKKESHGAGR